MKITRKKKDSQIEKIEPHYPPFAPSGKLEDWIAKVATMLQSKGYGFSHKVGNTSYYSKNNGNDIVCVFGDTFLGKSTNNKTAEMVSWSHGEASTTSFNPAQMERDLRLLY